MTYMSGKERRKRLVEQLRDEGRAARDAGKSLQSNPHKYMDAYQWSRGWVSRDEELQRQRDEEQEPRQHERRGGW